MKRIGFFLALSLVCILILTSCQTIDSLDKQLSTTELNDVINKFQQGISSAVSTAQDILTRQVTYQIIENVIWFAFVIVGMLTIFYIIRMYERKTLAKYLDRQLPGTIKEATPKQLSSAAERAQSIFDEEDRESFTWTKAITFVGGLLLSFIPLFKLLQCLINPGYVMLQVIKDVIK